MDFKDDIVAISSPSGMGAISLIRVSGEKALEKVNPFFRTKSGKKLLDIKSHSLIFGEFTNGDEAFAVHIEKNYINLDQPKYWVNDDDVIYLHPLKDGRLVSIVGNIRPDLANKVLISLDK